MKYLFYTLGGGLGHLSRVSAFIFTKKIPLEHCLILSSSPFVDRFFQRENFIQLPNHLDKKPKELSQYIQEIIDNNAFAEIYIDTFPFGIIGEFTYLDFRGISLTLLARDINWQKYSSNFKPTNTKYNKVYLFENIDKKHYHFLEKNSFQIEKIKLNYQKNKVDLKILKSITSNKEKWLIVHSTPEEEVRALLEYAKDLAKLKNIEVEFILITQCQNLDFEEVTVIDYFPAYDLFPYVDKIFTAAGFNLMQQTIPFRKKHICIPFPRKYDRQNLRFIKSKS